MAQRLPMLAIIFGMINMSNILTPMKSIIGFLKNFNTFIFGRGWNTWDINTCIENKIRQGFINVEFSRFNRNNTKRNVTCTIYCRRCQCINRAKLQAQH